MPTIRVNIWSIKISKTENGIYYIQITVVLKECNKKITLLQV